MDDLISRQAAIDALGEKPLAWTEGEYELGLQNQWQSDVDALNGLSSAQPEQDIEHCATCVHDEDSVEICVLRNCKYAIAKLIDCYKPKQPEQLTDKEQRIFLAAMGREEKICKEVDEECSREQYEDSLVRICHEITRKVKGALWNGK